MMLFCNVPPLVDAGLVAAAKSGLVAILFRFFFFFILSFLNSNKNKIENSYVLIPPERSYLVLCSNLKAKT